VLELAVSDTHWTVAGLIHDVVDYESPIGVSEPGENY
jgi:hypothetical protein